MTIVITLHGMLRLLPCQAFLFLYCLHGPTAAAEPHAAIPSPAPVDSQIREASQARPGTHTLYLEAFGKGGLYGAGYDYLWAQRLGLGVSLSTYQIDGERIVTASPYLSGYPLIRGHHAWFAHAGPRLVHSRVTSPVPLWDGARSTSLGAQISSGYEYRNRFVFRAFAMAVAGQGGISPWAGVSLGVAF